MRISSDNAEQRKLRSVARRYKRDGYRITIPGRNGVPPAFLEGLQPDLVAENDGEHVVIEVKRSDSIQGSNELLEIAERVSRQPGWRFELVTVSPTENRLPPTQARMDFIRNRARKAMGLGFADMAFTYAWSALEVVIWQLALQNSIKAAKMPFRQLVRELFLRGLLSRPGLEAIEHAGNVRAQMLRGSDDVVPTTADIEAILDLCDRVREEIALSV